MVDKNKTNRKLLITRIIYIAMIAAVIIYSLFLFVVIPSYDIRIFSPDDPEIRIIVGILGFITFISICIGYFLPPFVTKFYTGNTISVLSLNILRVSFFGSIGVFGLMLGIIGAELWTSMIFIFLSAATLILTFPSRTKWQKMTEKFESQNNTSTDIPII